MTSGRKRKERRRARLERERAEANTVRSPQRIPAAISGGQGAATDASVMERETRQNRVLEGVAVARGWVSAATPEKLAAVLNRQVMIAINPASKPREASVAAGVVVKAVGQVMQQEDREKGITGGSTVHVGGPTVNVGVQVNQAVASAVGSEPEYLEWLRQRELAEGGDADAVGANGFAASVPHSAPRLGNGSSGNGHTKGH